MYTINDLLDLSKTIAAPLFEGKTYPWEVLADISDYIIALGSTLPEEVRHCAFIRGSAIVGKNAVVGNSTELKNVVLFDNVQTPHYNYVGDSILGYKAHMGAGSITSNVKSDKTLVVIKNGDELIETGRKKVGAILGDCVEIGCNSVLNPGTVLGRRASVYPTSCVRGVVPEDGIYKAKDDIVFSPGFKIYCFEAGRFFFFECPRPRRRESAALLR